MRTNAKRIAVALMSILSLSIISVLVWQHACSIDATIFVVTSKGVPVEGARLVLTASIMGDSYVEFAGVTAQDGKCQFEHISKWPILGLGLRVATPGSSQEKYSTLTGKGRDIKVVVLHESYKKGGEIDYDFRASFGRKWNRNPWNAEPGIAIQISN